MLSKKSFHAAFLYLIALALFAMLHLTWFNYKKELDIVKEVGKLSPPADCEDYKQRCLSLYKKLRFPDPKTLFKLPPEQIPKELYDAFSQNGDSPLTKDWYIYEAYSDSSNNDKLKQKPVDIKQFNKDRGKVKNRQLLGYGDTRFQAKMKEYRNEIESRSIVIIGTVRPWIEAISYELNASKIITLDYTRKYWHKEKLQWIHVNDYLDRVLEEQLLKQIDNAATFSSIENSGWGRFGDILSPDGDLEAMKQVHCMIRPGGLFVVGGLPVTGEEKGDLHWNAHRKFGKKRLRQMFEGWKIVENQGGNFFVLRKKGKC